VQKAYGSKDGLRSFTRALPASLGPETQVNGERILALNGEWVYIRRSSYQKVPHLMDLLVSTTEGGEIRTLGMQPAKPYPPEAESPHLSYRTKSNLRLPFDGEWYVFWGGRSVAQNYHAEHADQRFAYDLEVVRNGSSHRGDGKANADYYCYGLPILAPGDGVIAGVLDGVPDNVPGAMNPKQVAGNYVSIDHGNGEFSMLCHLQPGSLAVSVGQRVKAGQKLGLTGNSGNTSEPHLHYHLQTTATFHKGLGLPPQFQNYRANGERVARGEPIQGQFIRPE
jgi:murein DD-endopeptidase MepM/ murein hydrolase activator NlpD